MVPEVEGALKFISYKMDVLSKSIQTKEYQV